MGADGKPVALRFEKDSGRAKEVRQLLTSTENAARQLHSLLEIPDDVLDKVVRLSATDPKWAQVKARIAAVQIELQSTIKGIPSDKDAALIKDGLGGGVGDMITFLRSQRGKRVWADSLGSLQGSVNSLLRNESGDETLFFKMPEDSGSFKLALDDEKVDEPDGTKVIKDGSRAGFSQYYKKRIAEGGASGLLKELSEGAEKGAKYTDVDHDAALRALKKVQKEQPGPKGLKARQKAQERYTAVRDAASTKGKKRSAEIKRLKRKIEAAKALKLPKVVNILQEKLDKAKSGDE